MVFPDCQACGGLRAHRALRASPVSLASRESRYSVPQGKTAGLEETDGLEFLECVATPDQQVTRAYLGAACEGRVPTAHWACRGLRVTRATPAGQAGRVKTVHRDPGAMTAATAPPEGLVI